MYLPPARFLPDSKSRCHIRTVLHAFVQRPEFWQHETEFLDEGDAILLRNAGPVLVIEILRVQLSDLASAETFKEGQRTTQNFVDVRRSSGRGNHEADGIHLAIQYFEFLLVLITSVPLVHEVVRQRHNVKPATGTVQTLSQTIEATWLPALGHSP